MDNAKYAGNLLFRLIAIAILIFVPVGSYMGYSDLVVDFVKTTTGNIPEGFIKIFYVFAPIAILEVSCVAVMVLVRRICLRYILWKAAARFNGFYGWHVTHESDVILDTLYIRNGFWHYMLPFIDAKPLVRYWRCYENGSVEGYGTTFFYGMFFKRTGHKQVKKDEVILIGAGPANDGNDILLKCQLIHNTGDQEVSIDVFYVASQHPHVKRTIVKSEKMFCELKWISGTECSRKMPEILFADQENQFSILYRDSKNKVSQVNRQ